MRSPKRGFKNVNRKEYAVFNLKQLELLFAEGEEVSPETLKEKGALKQKLDGVKILAYGTLSHRLTVSAHAFSAKAKEKIEAAGGKAQVIQTQTEEH
jgi:large subunit ribosomal protein L15